MKIIVSKVMKAKASYSSQRETVVTSSFGACSFAMDDGGRCLLDVINDPKLLQSFLESGSDENSKDPQDGTSSESAVESPQVARSSQNTTTLTNHLASNEHIVDAPDQMGYSYAVDGQGLLTQSGLCPTVSGLGGMSLIVTSSTGQQTYHQQQHASTSGATIHHLPTVTHSNLHPHSPASARSVTPVSHNIKSPGQGPSSVHSMPPPSPLQQTRSPLPSHTPSPAPTWSPAPPVLSPAPSRTQSSMPSVAFQQPHNQILQTSCGVTQFVTALATQQSLTQKLTLQQQQLFLQQQLSAAQSQASSRLTSVPAPVVTTTSVNVHSPMVQLIHAPSTNVALNTRTSHNAVRPIQPKLPPQILPKPVNCTTSNQFVSPVQTQKQAPPTPVTTAQRAVGVGIQPGAPGHLVIGQNQPGVFSGPQGTILLNQIIPGMGQSPILIQGNLGNLANIPGLQLTLRPPNSVSPGQSLNSSSNQNNATLIAALQGPSQHAQTLFAPTKSPIHGQQTIVIPNNLGHPGLTSQNINLTSAGIPNSGIISSSSQGQGFLARSNIILSPRIVGANQSIQLQQIQTPNGPIFAFAPAPSQTITVPHLGNAQLAPVTVPMHGVIGSGQGVISGLSLQSHAPQSALQQHQSLFGTAVPFTSHLEHSSPQVIQVPQPMAQQQVPSHIQNQQQQPIELSPKPASPPKPSKVPSVNLEELLKEHGIVPENSPVPSPECNSPIMEEPVPSQTILPSPQQLISALQSQQVVLEQHQGHPALSHLKLAFTQDGSVILQPQGGFNNAPRVQHYVSTPNPVHGRTPNHSVSVGSVIFPTLTTTTSTVSVPVPISTPESTPAPSRNHSTLIARLNSAPAISVPDVLSTSVVLSTTPSTTITTSTTTLVPLTVQSLSVNSSPIASSYVVQRTNSSPSDRLYIAEDIHMSQSRVTPVISSSSSAQSVQNRINHVNSAAQSVSIVVPKEQPNRTTIQHTSKTVQCSQAGTSATVVSSQTNVQRPETQKCVHRETHQNEVVDNGTVPSHNHVTLTPNVLNLTLQRIQKELQDMGLVKNRNPEQNKIFNQLTNAQQKIFTILQNKGKGGRSNQNQFQLKLEAEVEKLLQRSQASYNTIIEPQLPPKAAVSSTSQPSVQVEKPPNVNIKPTNSHSLQLVNLLKQSSPHNAPVRHIAPSTTTITSVCDSTTPAVIAPIHQKQVNRVLTPPPPRLQTPNQFCSKQSTDAPQQQVIVRLQKPVQQPAVQTCPNPVPIKVPPPVKRIINTVPKTVLIKDKLAQDQNAVMNPDYKTPFTSKADACRRLLKYHVFNTKDACEADMYEDERLFAEKAVLLKNKMQQLNNKYRFLKLQESMRVCVTPDQVLIERLFIQDEEEALRSDRAAVAEGKSLSLPPPPKSWLQKLKASRRSPSPVLSSDPLPPSIVIKEEKTSDIEDNDCYSREHTTTPEDSDPLYKEDDNLEAPVIDSCEDIVVSHHNENCERSPPTLKRIVIKPNHCSESDSEEPVPSRKRLKYNNVSYNKTETDWTKENDFESKHKFPLLTRETFNSDNRIDDIVSELGKGFDMSPMEIDDRGVETNHLVDFEPPVPRTEENNLLYNNRNNCVDKYDFDLLACSDWTEEYVQHHRSESDENNIIGNHDNPSDLDLSGLDGLEDHLDDSQHCIPNGIEDNDSAESELNYVDYRIPKHNKRYLDSSSEPPESNCVNTRDQVQNAIKSIMGNPTENNQSYFESVESDFLSLNKRHSHNTHMVGFSRNTDISTSSSHRGEHDLEEAVRSILL